MTPHAPTPCPAPPILSCTSSNPVHVHVHETPPTVHETPTDPWTSNDLRRAMEALSRELDRREWPMPSYTDIAIRIGLGKSTVYSVIHNQYQARTKADHADKIGNFLQSELAKLDIDFIRPSLRPKAQRTSRIERIRVHHTGFLYYNERHYYAGDRFASNLVTISRIKRSEDIHISLDRHTRDLSPVDPTGNQLGYDPAEAIAQTLRGRK